jgi:malonate-semialdehyde dehydrogenase (acetylating)/methylmalonate-semialdehyde dehydrogenase
MPTCPTSISSWNLRASKLGDLGPYGKQAILFYTQTKTVTSRWFDEAEVGGVNTTISMR